MFYCIISLNVHHCEIVLSQSVAKIEFSVGTPLFRKFQSEGAHLQTNVIPCEGHHAVICFGLLCLHIRPDLHHAVAAHLVPAL